MSSAAELQGFGEFVAAKEYVPQTCSSAAISKEEDIESVPAASSSTVEDDAFDWMRKALSCPAAPISHHLSAVWTVDQALLVSSGEPVTIGFGSSLSEYATQIVTYTGSLSAPIYSLGESGAFDVLDALRNPETEIRNIFVQFQISSTLPYKDKLLERLEMLIEAMRDEGESWTEDSTDSLRKLLFFLETVPHFRLPEITITPAATFRAQWTEGDNAHFAIDFLPDGQVHFVVFCTNPRHPRHVKRFAGKTSWETLMRDVGPYNVGGWSRAR